MKDRATDRYLSRGVTLTLATLATGYVAVLAYVLLALATDTDPVCSGLTGPLLGVLGVWALC